MALIDLSVLLIAFGLAELRVVRQQSNRAKISVLSKEYCWLAARDHNEYTAHVQTTEITISPQRVCTVMKYFQRLLRTYVVAHSQNVFLACSYFQILLITK